MRRFGFITTNSIMQAFSRRVIERHMAAKEPLSLIYAVPNHPWMKASDKAAVRIAMTVAEKSEREGVLAEVVSEAGLNSDTPQVALESREGKVRADLTVGADLSRACAPLQRLACKPGRALHGAGFIVSPPRAASLAWAMPVEQARPALPSRTRRCAAPSRRVVVDLFPLEIDEVRARFLAVYQHLLERVKPERDNNRADFRREYGGRSVGDIPISPVPC